MLECRVVKITPPPSPAEGRRREGGQMWGAWGGGRDCGGGSDLPALLVFGGQRPLNSSGLNTFTKRIESHEFASAMKLQTTSREDNKNP